MSNTVISSSSNSTEKAIDEYYDTTNNSGSSNSSHSSEGSSTDEGYTFGVPDERLNSKDWVYIAIVYGNQQILRPHILHHGALILLILLAGSYR